MRAPFLLVLIATAAGLTGAQNSTTTTGSSADIGKCVLACDRQVVQDNPGDVNKCAGISDATKLRQCVCRSDALINGLGTCISSTCPDLVAGTDVGQQLRQACDEINAAPSVRTADFLPAAAALIVAALLF